MIIEVAETRAAPAGKKIATIIAAGGTKFDCWPEMLASVEVGRRYEVEVESREWNGKTFQKITKATPVNGAAQAPAPTSTTKPMPYTNGNGHAGNGNSYRRTDPVDSERMFVCAALTAFIKAGKVEPELGKVTNAVNVLRTAYQRTFGMDDAAE
jgi:hypothetical protein